MHREPRKQGCSRPRSCCYQPPSCRWSKAGKPGAHRVTLGVLSHQASFPPSTKAGGHVEDPMEVGMLRHPRPGQRGPRQLETAVRGLGPLGARPRETGSAGCAVGSHEAVICSWFAVCRQVVTTGEEKIRGKNPEVRHISPFSCCCCPLQSLSYPQRFGWKKTQNAVFGFLWREALAQLLEYQ